ncbi:MAG: sulfurase [Rhodothermaceae bacterium]|nr:sulfurase [Rhodothermaceae bacterium]
MAPHSPYALLPQATEPDYDVVRAWRAALDALPLGETGSVAHLITKSSPGEHAEVAAAEVAKGVGLVADHRRKDWYLGKRVPGREVSAVSLDVLRVLGVDPRVVGDNLVVADFDLAALEPGDRIHVGEVLLVRSEVPHRPCPLFRHRTTPEAFHAIRHGRHRGALFYVAKGGTIRQGDPIIKL